tara:strand:+ start:1426 stop:2625 length:1200 start_codon:yes stop_codon:yes gene_type:complete
MTVPLIQLPRPETNGYATLALYVATSTFDEPKEYAGINHLLEHVLACNSDIDQDVAKKGLEHNAETHGGYVRYWFSTPKEHFKFCLDFLLRISSRPTWKHIEREKKAVRQELLSLLQDPEYHADLAVVEQLFPDTGFFRGQSAEIMLKGLDKLNEKDLKNYYDNYYRGRMFIVISGGPPVKGAKKTMKIDTISSVPCMTIPKQHCFNIIRPEISKSECKILFYSKNNEPNSDKIRHRMRLATRILAGGLDSLLYRSLRDKLNLVYSVSCDSEIEPYAILIEINWSCDTNKVTKSIKAIFNVIKNFYPLHYGGHKNLFLERFVRDNLLTSQDIVEIYGDSLVTWGYYKEIKDSAREIEKIGPKELKKVVDKYLNPKNSLFIHTSSNKKNIITDSSYKKLF